MNSVWVSGKPVLASTVELFELFPEWRKPQRSKDGFSFLCSGCQSPSTLLSKKEPWWLTRSVLSLCLFCEWLDSFRFWIVLHWHQTDKSDRFRLRDRSSVYLSPKDTRRQCPPSLSSNQLPKANTFKGCMISLKAREQSLSKVLFYFSIRPKVYTWWLWFLGLYSYREFRWCAGSIKSPDSQGLVRWRSYEQL